MVHYLGFSIGKIHMAQTGNRRLLLTSLCEEEGPTEVGLVRPRVVKRRREMRGRSVLPIDHWK